MSADMLRRIVLAVSAARQRAGDIVDEDVLFSRLFLAAYDAVLGRPPHYVMVEPAGDPPEFRPGDHGITRNGRWRYLVVGSNSPAVGLPLVVMIAPMGAEDWSPSLRMADGRYPPTRDGGTEGFDLLPPEDPRPGMGFDAALRAENDALRARQRTLAAEIATLQERAR